jgi:hypothetical protein
VSLWGKGPVRVGSLWAASEGTEEEEEEEQAPPGKMKVSEIKVRKGALSCGAVRVLTLVVPLRRSSIFGASATGASLRG